MKNRKKYLKVIIFGIIFVILFGLEIYQLLQEKKKYQDYETIIGEYDSADVYSSDDDGTTYKLTYRYYVQGKWYAVTTNYGTGIVPSKGTPRKIRYHKEFPEKAIIVGIELSELCFLGMLICTIIISTSLKNILIKKNDIVKNAKCDYSNSILIGVTFSYGASLIYKLITGTKNIFSFFDLFLSYGLVLLFVLFFALLGIFIVVYTSYCFITKKWEKESKKVKNEETEEAKIKREKLEKNIDNFIEKSITIGTKISVIVKIFMGIAMTLLLIYIFYIGVSNKSIFTDLIGLPFVLTAFSITIHSIIILIRLYSKKEMSLEKIRRMDRIQTFFVYIPMVSFLCFWFGLLGVGVVSAIQENEWGVALFTIPFWLAGIYIAVNLFKGIKKK